MSILRWCRARDLFGSQTPVITGGFEMQISCIRSSYLTQAEVLSKPDESVNVNST